MAVATSSHRQYEVFISFLGEDTRYSFISYLHDSLSRKGIDAFIDEELLRGSDLSVLLETIERSKMSIVVFSENYANSTWCLMELAKIIECKMKFEHVVVPVFYKVRLSDVQHQTGRFGAPFHRVDESFYGFEDRVATWKRALNHACDLVGFVLPERSPENEFIDIIAQETFKLISLGSKLPMNTIQGNQVDAARNYPQVFINFRGKQLRYNFVSHLVNAFESQKIKFFLDKYELRGKDLQNLFLRIEESSIALVIFSVRYPESSWCMDELAEIKKLADKGKLQVIPIFYKVEPEDVEKQKGKFGDNFWTLAKDSTGSQIKKWKDALECISKKTGLPLGSSSSESDFIKEIVMELQRVIATMGIEEGEDHYELPDFKRIKTRHF